MNKTVAFFTLGCKLNTYEVDALSSDLQKMGYTVVDFSEKADCYIINTCTVTNKADRKSRNIINRTLRWEHDPLVVVTGCFVNGSRDELEASYGKAFLVDNEHKSQIVNLVDSYFRGETIHLSEMPSNLFNFNAITERTHTRTLVKVQDGCDNFCTFCIIPTVRGQAESRPFLDVLQNVREIIATGTKEVVLTGVNLGRYDYDGKDFADLVEAILELSGEFRLRISSIEPDPINDKLIKLLSHPKMAPHLHICLQSGSEKVLLAMRRQYTYDFFKQTVEKIRKVNPLFNITTDIIVGFPGESEEDHQASINAVKEIGFSHVHTFPFSVRKDTRAERMSGKIRENIKKERAEDIRITAENEKRKYRTQLIGLEQTILVETVKNGIAAGYGELYVPVKVELPEAVENEFYTVKITSIEEGDDPSLIAELISG